MSNDDERDYEEEAAYNDDGRDLKEEAHNRRHMEEEGRAELEAEAVAAAKADAVKWDDPDTAYNELHDACTAAGIVLDAYDLQLLSWLARSKTSTAPIVFYLIGRAHEGGRAHAAAELAGRGIPGQ